MIDEIPDGSLLAPGYILTPAGDVFSLPRTVTGKGGSVRHLAGRWLTPDAKGRVSLRIDGQTVRMSVATPAARRKALRRMERKISEVCRDGHSLADAFTWGAGNRICRQCHPNWTP